MYPLTRKRSHRLSNADLRPPSPCAERARLVEPPRSPTACPLQNSTIDCHLFQSKKKRRMPLYTDTLPQSQSSQFSGLLPWHESIQTAQGVRSSAWGSKSTEAISRSSLPQQYLSSRGSSSRELEIQFHRSPSPGSLGHKAHASAAISKSSDISSTKDRASPWSLESLDRSTWAIANEDINAATKTSKQCIDDTRKALGLTLPSFIPDNREGLPPHIDTNTLAGLMGAGLRECFDNLVVIDCRFKYEFDGGHIKGAVNYSDKAALKDLFHSPKTHTVLVLYCEYSSFRAPTMFKHVRQMDRKMNSNTYPNLTYPDMFILNGGYEKAFTEHRSLCIPQNYVKMSDEDHNVARERGLCNIKRHSKLIS